MEPLLEIKNLTARFKGVESIGSVLKNISLQVKAGETIGLVGESGSGKSVLAHTIMRLYSPKQFEIETGALHFKGTPLLALPESDMQTYRGRRMAMVFQEPMTSLNPLKTVQHQLEEALFLHQMYPQETYEERICDILNRVQLGRDSHRILNAFPHQLSGGQRQRILIAMALLNHPEILIADEPTTALDVTTQAEIIRLLRTIQEQDNMALVMITHNLELVRKMTSRIVVLYKGEIVEEAATQALFASPKHPYTRMLIGAEPHIKIEAVNPTAQKCLSIEDAYVSYQSRGALFSFKRDQMRVVKGVSLHVKEGETVALVGESGSGKTTLGLALARLLPMQGKLSLLGKEISFPLSRKERQWYSQQVQMVFQDPFGSLNPRHTIDQILSEGLQVHASHLSGAERVVQVCEMLEHVGLDPAVRSRYPHEFSGGQRQRMALARALLVRPKVIILDEPTSALDRSVQMEVVEVLHDIQKKYNLAYLFITHDLKLVRSISHRVYVMRQGEICESGEVHQIFQAPRHAYTQKLLETSFLG